MASNDEREALKQKLEQALQDGWDSGDYDDILDAATDVVIEERRAAYEQGKRHYEQHPGQYSQAWIADQLGISRPTLAKWLKNPELFTIGAVNKLAALQQEQKTLSPAPATGSVEDKQS